MTRLSGDRRSILVPALTLLLLFAVSCDEDAADPESGAQAYLRIVSGDGQTERTGAWAPRELVVGVRDIIGTPLAGRAVSFSCGATGAQISPETAVSDETGIAAVRVRLGEDAGEQTVLATVAGDEAVFSLYAVEIACDEASLPHAGAWTPGHVFISTPSSTLLAGAGSAVIEYDPDDGSIEKILETAEILTDIAFSPRGDLYVASSSAVYRVDPATKTLVSHLALTAAQPVEIEPNPGGVLVGIRQDALFTIGCPGEDPATLYEMGLQLDPALLVVDPGDRAIYAFDPEGSVYWIFRLAWDGFDEGPLSVEMVEAVTGGPDAPNGACMDADGAMYLVMDSNESERRIWRFHPAEGSESLFYNLYLHDVNTGTPPGRWGDAAVRENALYLIDTRNNRLVWLTIGDGNGTWGGMVENTAFSRPGTDSERYGIAVSPAP
ncbi:MAG: hypothetical protein JW876_00390 [Candidatus Krumholzibacteriota bacterium]|nr:hypothetical protein [Candidatus Krumholzibacteriota bacterium]